MAIKRIPRLLRINRTRQRRRSRRARRNKFQRLSLPIHSQLHQVIRSALTQRAQRACDFVVGSDSYSPSLSKTLPPRPSTLERLRLFDFLERLFLRRERVPLFLVREMFLPPFTCEFGGFGCEYALSEVFAAEFADEGQSRASEEHFLPDGRRIGDVGYGY